jgi:polysaccharide deacetylase family protein (PEP-CTERM system associated)
MERRKDFGTAAAMATSASPPPPSAATASPAGGRHVLTVALEDYFQVAPLKSVIRTDQWYRFETRVERNTVKTLDLLDEFGLKATFFVVGWIADEMPEVVRRVAGRGHEIASKGYYHRSLRQLGREEFREDLLRSREALERAAGTPVDGYRIAHGWFTPQDLWALDVLAEEGFLYDSSLRPIFRRFAREPQRRFVFCHHRGDRALWELPLSSWCLGGWSFPIAGGNYLRQLPRGLMRRAVDHWHHTVASPLVVYFHVWELDPDQPRIRAAPLLERVRQYRNLEKMDGILREYLGRYRFAGVREYLAQRGVAAARAVAPPAVPSRAPAAVAVAAAPAARTAVTVVVPCFNEESTLPYLANTLRSLAATLEDRYALSFIFVDDASSDATLEVLGRLFGARPDCAVIGHAENRGVAAAIQSGIREARTEIVCSIDCDCTYDPHQLRALIPMLKGDVDLVTASPYHPQGRVRNVPAWRLALSKGLSFLYRRLLRHRLATYTSCFRVYRRSSVAALPVREGGFLGVVEMLALLDLAGGRIVECPAVLDVRLLGRSKMRVAKSVAGHLRLLVRMAAARYLRPARLSLPPPVHPPRGLHPESRKEDRWPLREFKR